MPVECLIIILYLSREKRDSFSLTLVFNSNERKYSILDELIVREFLLILQSNMKKKRKSQSHYWHWYQSTYICLRKLWNQRTNDRDIKIVPFLQCNLIVWILSSGAIW